MSTLAEALTEDFGRRWLAGFLLLRTAAIRWARHQAAGEPADHPRRALARIAEWFVEQEEAWRGLGMQPPPLARVGEELLAAARGSKGEDLERAALAYRDWAQTLGGWRRNN